MESPITTVGRLYDHQFLQAVADAVSQVSAEVMATGGKGKVNITVDVAPFGQGQMTVETATSIRVTLPKPAAKKAMFFLGKDGSLQASDPRQAEMQVRSAPNGATELRAPEWEEPTIRESAD